MKNPEEEKILHLEEKALGLHAAIGLNTMELARVFVELHSLLPWRRKIGTREPITIKAHFRDVMGVHRKTGIRGK